ncbi:hypothetical protein EMIHUDRAFT_201035 [Emiliania huxleyi CCMP1516]|uniref:Uncharacterized protein n=2 Tax=Emiliania huxleyi TaxID=2903 RepID=A0A0D3KM18_EMIH1|nr:hypothetical protein EMIHUDRAFT_201035 [Emiliania huxleyi CCMP1516]EOD36803.1 hypothetical protein EMIHUDRAFT_201035 [Emiliania huxleyi CCMP1516]|eukprot:XP_005789232.1 hypothetical protein EMIHUDRAFT_201035 [Emiliania huxleyi CCMP1516]
MPELPPYVPEFDLAFFQMLGAEAAVDIALQLLTDDGGLQALLASDEPSAERVALEGADNALANSRASLLLLCASYGVTAIAYGFPSGKHGLDYCIAEADTTSDMTASTTMAPPPWTSLAPCDGARATVGS